jgi:hypothetical protein
MQFFWKLPFHRNSQKEYFMEIVGVQFLRTRSRTHTHIQCMGTRIQWVVVCHTFTISLIDPSSSHDPEIH